MPRLLIVDDDGSFSSTLQRAFEQRGYTVRCAQSVTQARELLNDWLPDFAVVDLCLRDAWGLALIPDIKAASPAARVVVLTGFPSTATAVEAIKLGATHYLAKPAAVGEIELAFVPKNGHALIPPGEKQSAPS